MTDPQEVHGVECAVCLKWQFDNEEDVNERGVCWDCVDAAELAEIGEEDNDY